MGNTQDNHIGEPIWKDKQMKKENKKNMGIEIDFSDPEIEKRINNMMAEIEYLSDDEWKAVNKMILMTQTLFDSIMEKRGDIGPDLEDLSLSLSLEYGDYLINYANRKMKEAGITEEEAESWIRR